MKNITSKGLILLFLALPVGAYAQAGNNNNNHNDDTNADDKKARLLQAVEFWKKDLRRTIPAKVTSNEELSIAINELRPLDAPSLEALHLPEESLNKALAKAARAGNLLAVYALVQAGADISAGDEDDLTPLTIACTYGHLDVVNALIALGADVYARDNCQDTLGDYEYGFEPARTALHWAAETGHLAIVKVLLQAGLSIDERDEYNRPPLYWLVLNSEDKLESESHLDVLRELIARGADLMSQDANGDTLLNIAAYIANFKIVELLLQTNASASVNVADNNGNTPLHSVIDHPSDDSLHAEAKTRTIELLLQAGAWVNAVNKKGKTPLHTAIQSSNLSIILALIEGGADINAKDNEGRTPLDFAKQAGQEEVVDFLSNYVPNSRNNNNSNDSYIERITNESPSLMDLFDWERENAPALAIKSVTTGKIHLDERDLQDRTALHLAAESGHLSIIVALIQDGADINAKDNEGRTPLDLAKEAGQEEVVNFLSNYVPNSQNNNNSNDIVIENITHEEADLIDLFDGMDEEDLVLNLGAGITWSFDRH